MWSHGSPWISFSRMRFKCYQKDPGLNSTHQGKEDPFYGWLKSLVLGIWYSQLCRLPRWLSGKESTCQCRSHRRPGFDPWVRKIPWRRKWLCTPVFLPGKFHGQRECGGPQFIGSQRTGHNWATECTHTFSALVTSQGNSLTPLWGLSVAGSTHPQSTRAAASLLPC